MIYSSTMYWTAAEAHLLALKLSEEATAVDGMIVAEATTTHRGTPRPLELASSGCLRCVTVDTSEVKGAHRAARDQREAMQRDAAIPPGLEDDDVVIVTDLDEIVHAVDVPRIAEAARTHGLVRIDMRMYRYWIDWQRNYNWPVPFAATGAFLRGKSLTAIRRSAIGVLIPSQSQHFTWTGNEEARLRKNREFIHAENEAARRQTVLQRDAFSDRESYVTVQVDGSYPAAIRDNIDRWREHIRCD